MKRGHMLSVTLLFNTFSWYFMGRLIIGNISSGRSFESLWLELSYSLAIIVAALVGSVIFKKVQKVRFFYIWLLLGVGASLGLMSVANSSFLPILFGTSCLGISLGLGMPSCLGYFTESVPIENRGKSGGIVLFATTFSAPLALVATATIGTMWSILLLAVWRAWSLPLLFCTAGKELPSKHHALGTPSLAKVLQNRTFYLYFIAWLMFALVDSFETMFVNLRVGEFQLLMGIMEPAVAGFSALIGGIISDWVGRKRVLIFGFVSLGIAYATIGFLSQIWISWFFYFIIDGMALGLLWVMFTIVIWGEVNREKTEKYYAVGETPFFLTQMLYIALMPYVESISESSAFSLAAFFLFIAVVPLLFAPETLPEKKMKQRQLKMYTKEAIQLKQSVEQKSND
ncbi:MAG: MFS transporter [Candidatus Bathyarchaeota archaeon]|nr:MAG: MFS transporter [Candidatus Bathyarchaeota archaeon]